MRILAPDSLHFLSVICYYTCQQKSKRKRSEHLISPGHGNEKIKSAKLILSAQHCSRRIHP